MQNLNITLAQADLHWHDPPANRRMFADLAAGVAKALGQRGGGGRVAEDGETLGGRGS